MSVNKMSIKRCSEKQLENRIKKWLDNHGVHRIGKYQDGDCGWWLKFHGGDPTMPAGIPDMLICINGFFIGAELKKEDGRLSELQRLKLEQINKTGGWGVEVRPSNEEEFYKKIIKIIKKY